MKSLVSILMAFSLPLALAGGFGLLNAPVASDNRSPKAIAAEAHVVKWLESQRSGESGAEYWHTYAKSVSRLYSVKNWEIVKQPNAASHTAANVIIESSNKGGIPIRKTWRIHVKTDLVDGEIVPRISQLEDLSE